MGRKNPGAPGTEPETPRAVHYILQPELPPNPTISTLLLVKKVKKIPSSFKEGKKKRKGKYAANSPVCVFDLAISVANFPKRHKQTHAEPEYQ